MASFTNVGAFSKHVREGAAVIQRSQRTAVEAAALSAKTALLAAPGAPKGKVAKGRVGVKYQIFGFDRPTARVGWYGPAHLVNNPTKAHEIENKQKGKPRRALSSRGRGGDFGPTHSAQHPGTRGKHFYERGRDAAAVLVPQVLRRTFKIALGRHFGGIS